jgi:hypothetical protein
MNDVPDNLNKIKKMYSNLTYFDRHGSQVVFFILLTLFVFLTYAYCTIMANFQLVKDDWANQRCNIKVIPFAGFINRPPGKSISEFAEENFVYCIQGILQSMAGPAFQPLTYSTNLLQNLYGKISNDVQGTREMMNKVRNNLSNIITHEMDSSTQLKCFDQDTPLELLNGKVVSISDICVGDVLNDESIVTARMKVDASNLDMYSIKNVVVSGCHYVKSNDEWIHVSKDKRSKKLDSYSKPYLYCINTTSKTIVIDDIIFSDWDDIFDEKLNEKKKYIAKTFAIDYAKVSDKDIHKYLDGGFDSNTMIRLQDKSLKFISDVQIHDILENGECVYGIVEIDGTNVKKQISCILGKHKHFVGGHKLNFFDENLGEISTFKLCNENYYALKKNSEKLYHLITDRGTFKVWDLLFNDYNSCIDLE